MSHLVIINRTRDSVLGTRVLLADRWWQRVRGFLGRPEPGAGEGILLDPCRAVHSLGMRYPLDVIFIDDAGRVVATYAPLRPGGRTRWHRRASCALELPSGTIVATGTEPGDHVAWLVHHETLAASTGSGQAAPPTEAAPAGSA